MRRMWFASLLLLAACGGDRPGRPPLTWEQAMYDRIPRQVKVLRVWDDLESPPEGARTDGRVTHYVEVEYRPAGSDDAEPERALWPFDGFALRAAPPRPGTMLVVAPRDWLGGRRSY